MEFNAWETDFAQDPFIALYAEIARGLDELPGPQHRILLHRLRSAGGAVVRAAPASTLRLAMSGIPLIGSQLVQEMSSTPRQTVAETYAETKAALQSFRSLLGKTAQILSETSDRRPMVVLIDELDRCRPSYAIELLEAAKHLFNVDHIVFVVCLDRAQLAHSVKAVYGASFDAEGYLWRFFDIDYRLPHPDRKAFVDHALDSVGIRELLENRSTAADPRDAIRIIAELFSASPFTLRRVLHAIHRFAVVLASVPSSQTINPNTLVVLLLVRTVLPDLYRRIVMGETTDEAAVNTLFDRPGFAEVRSARVGSLVHGVLIACVLHSSQRRDGTVDMTKLPLLQRYRSVVERSVSEEQSHPDERRQAGVATQFVDRCYDLLTAQDSGEVRVAWSDIGFEDAVRRIELFSDDLTGTELG